MACTKAVKKIINPPKNQMQMGENINNVLGFLRNDGVALGAVSARGTLWLAPCNLHFSYWYFADIMESNDKAILGLIWSIVRHYQVMPFACTSALVHMFIASLCPITPYAHNVYPHYVSLARADITITQALTCSLLYCSAPGYDAAPEHP